MREISENKAKKQFGAKRLRAVWEDGDDPDIKTVDWRESVSEVLKEVDEQRANNLTPVPGCTQGGFTPYFV